MHARTRDAVIRGYYYYYLLAKKSPDLYLRCERTQRPKKNYTKKLQGTRPSLLAAANKAGEKRFHPCDKDLHQMRGAR